MMWGRTALPWLRRALAGAIVSCLSAGAFAQTWGGQLSSVRGSAEVAPTSDGGCIAAGTAAQVASSRGGYLAKLSAAGDTEWFAQLDGSGYQTFETVTEIAAGYLVGGRDDAFGQRGWLVLFDRWGRLLRQESWAADMGEWRDSVAMPDGGAALFMPTWESLPIPYYVVLRVDSEGREVWRTGLYFQDPTRVNVSGTVLTLLGLPDGSLIAAGEVVRLPLIPGSGVSRDACVVKLDSGGTIEWQRAHGDPDPSSERYEALALGRQGDIYAAGRRNSSIGDPYINFVSRLGPDGSLIWTREFPSLPGSTAQAPSVAGAADGGCFFAQPHWTSSTSDGSFLVHLDRDGHVVAAVYLPDELVRDLADAPGAGVFAGGDGAFVARFDEACTARSPCIVQEASDIEPWAAARDEWVPDYGQAPVALSTRIGSATPELYPMSAPCLREPCPPLSCGGIVAQPARPCAGAELTLASGVAGGELTLVEWDLDGDGGTDRIGDPIHLILPAGTWSIGMVVRDECPESAQACSDRIDLVVADGVPVREVSDVASGAPPLRITRAPETVTFEAVAGADSYALHAGGIGDWYATSPAFGSACGLSASPNGDGTASVPADLAAGSWFVVTATGGCAEGAAGRDSAGAERSAHPTWQGCP